MEPGLQPSGGPSLVPPRGHWLGLVVPKRMARRAITRNLIKRQMRGLAADWAAQLPPGLWVLRLKSGFDRAVFRSASSDALRQAAREELNQLLQRASEGAARPAIGRRPAADGAHRPAARPLAAAVPSAPSAPSASPPAEPPAHA